MTDAREAVHQRVRRMGRTVGYRLSQRVHKKIKELCPGLKVLYMSGHTGMGMTNQRILKAGNSLLQKPYSPDALLQKVHEVLNEPRQRKA